MRSKIGPEPALGLANFRLRKLRGGNQMLFAKYLLTTIGCGFLAGAAGILLFDLYLFLIGMRRPTDSAASLGYSDGEHEPELKFRWAFAGRVAACGLLPLLFGLSINVVPSGRGG